MKKKVIALLLATMMSFSMVACGETETKEAPKQETEAKGKEEVPEEEPKEEVHEEPKKEEIKSEKIKDIEAEIETASVEKESATQSDVNEEKFIEDIKNAISGAVGEDEFITDISFANGDLRIYVDIMQADPAPLTYEDLALSRTSSITDDVLGLSEYLDTWNTVTVDFGTLGFIRNGKNNMADDGYGPYFKSINFKLES